MTTPKGTAAMRLVRRLAPIALVAALGIGAAACGSDSPTTTNDNPGTTAPGASTTAPESGGAGF